MNRRKLGALYNTPYEQPYNCENNSTVNLDISLKGGEVSVNRAKLRRAFKSNIVDKTTKQSLIYYYIRELTKENISLVHSVKKS